MSLQLRATRLTVWYTVVRWEAKQRSEEKLEKWAAGLGQAWARLDRNNLTRSGTTTFRVTYRLDLPAALPPERPAADEHCLL